MSKPGSKPQVAKYKPIQRQQMAELRRMAPEALTHKDGPCLATRLGLLIIGCMSKTEFIQLGSLELSEPFVEEPSSTDTMAA
jgi:hypothetical protein